MDPVVDAIRDQAAEVARGWSGPDADPGWALTAALFDAIATDDDILRLASEIPSDRIPALLVAASIQRVVAEHPEDPLRAYFPGPGQRPVDAGFAATLGRFVVDRPDELRRWFGHRYQMNEVGRCVQTALALGVVQDAAPGHPVALVDVGTGSGLGLHLDRYHVDLGPAGSFGPAESAVRLRCAVEGAPPVPPQPPQIIARVGIEAAPMDLDDEGSRAWLAACLPPTPDGAQRLAAAIAVTRAARAPIVRGDGAAVLPDVLADLPGDPLVVVIDSYTAVFFDDDQRARITTAIEHDGRDAVWISLDPLVPLGTEAQRSVQDLPVDAELVRRNRSGGVFALLSIRGTIAGRPIDHVLATAHPSGARMTWLGP
ncbi:MAG: DUF2332 family protein [Ilumatobacteraceae bacterium]